MSVWWPLLVSRNMKKCPLCAWAAPVPDEGVRVPRVQRFLPDWVQPQTLLCSTSKEHPCELHAACLTLWTQAVVHPPHAPLPLLYFPGCPGGDSTPQ